MDLPLHVALREHLARLPFPPTDRWPGGARDVEVFAGPAIRLVLFAPDTVDSQQPHTEDELYVVVRGGGTFVCGTRSAHFQAGDVLFAPAGVPHRFIDFGAELVTWVVFWPPATPTDAPRAAELQPTAPRETR